MLNLWWCDEIKLSNPVERRSWIPASSLAWPLPPNQNPPERELFIDNLLVRIHLIIVMIRWTGLAPWEFELFF